MIAAITSSVVVVVIIITILTIIILHKVHNRVSSGRNRSRPRPLKKRAANNESSIDNIIQSPSPTYDDILSFSERQRQEQEDITTNCNQAYGVTHKGKPPNTGCNADTNKQSTGEAAASSELTHASLEDDNGLMQDNGVYNDIQTWIGIGEAASLQDEPHDYQNVLPPDHLFGEYVRPEFCRPSSSTGVRPHMKTVDYAELQSFTAGNKGMTTSMSLPDILAHLNKNERQNGGKINITLPSSQSTNFTLV